MKIEGLDGILLEEILTKIQKEMGYKTQEETVTKFINALSYNVVYSEIISQLKWIESRDKEAEA